MNPAEGHDPLVDRRILNFHIEEKLGAGGMGVVYRAVDERLGRTVALKFLPLHLSGGNARTRFLTEARAISALDHPNIGVIHGIEESPDGQLFIVLAFYEGQTLASLLRDGPVSESRAVNIARQVALALAEAHSKGILHRDVKPANIMITRQNVVKLLDFGLAKLSDSDNLTVTGHAVGTPAYMSPEQALGEIADHRTDVWALGVILYEMLTGRRPFSGETTQAMFLSIARSAPPPLEGAGEELRTLVYRCLTKDPALRYQDAWRLSEDLAALAPSPDLPTRTQLLPSSSGKSPARKTSSSAAYLQAGATPPPTSFGRPFVWVTGAAALLIAVGTWFGATRWRSGPLVPREKHIVVLPFNNIGGDPANAALCDGIEETLTSRLSTLEQAQTSLWVAPSSEVRRRNINDASGAQRTFGANLVVTGSVQRDSRGVRLTVNLIDARSLRQLGSVMIDDRLGDFATLQDNAVIQLAKLLEVQSNSNATERPAGESATPAAYESYLKGLSYLQRYDKPGNLETAIQLLSGAVNADPRFALGFARLAEAEWLEYKATNNAALMERALSDGKHAAEINDQLAPVHVTLGRLQVETGKYDLAVEQFQRALALDPRNAEAYQRIARAYESQGRPAEAEASLKKAIALRPDYWDGYNSLGAFYYRRGKFKEGAAEFRKVLELTPDNAQAWMNLGVMLQKLQDRPGARQAFQKALGIAPSYAAYTNLANVLFDDGEYANSAAMFEKALSMNSLDYRPWAGLGEAYFAAGNPGKGRPAYERAITLAEKESARNPNDSVVLSYVALYYAKLGVRDKAVERLGTAVALAPEDALTLDLAARTSATLGDRAAALKYVAGAVAHGQPKEDVARDLDFKSIRDDVAFRSLIQ